MKKIFRLFRDNHTSLLKYISYKLSQPSRDNTLESNQKFYFMFDLFEDQSTINLIVQNKD